MTNMFPRHFNHPERIKKITFGCISITLLFLGFYINLWGVARPSWFNSHQRDTESYILGRMVKSHRDGIFSAGGLNGVVIIEDIPQQWGASSGIDRQYIAYLNLTDLTFDAFSTYNSQPAGQGMIFSLFDRILPLPNNIKLQTFYILTSLLTAIALTTIISWFNDEFGLWVAVCVLISAILSGWLTVFGKNLWWCTWVFYLPMIVVLYFLKRYREPISNQFLKFGTLVFIAMSIKCFINGYEYITTTILMMIVPFVYYGILDKWNKHSIMKWTIAAGIGSGLAILLSLIMLCFQIGAVRTGFIDGLTHVIYSFEKRTYGSAEGFPPIYAASLDAGTIEVVVKYLNGIYLDLNNYLTIKNTFVSKYLLQIRYTYLIVLFVIVTILLYLRNKVSITSDRSRSYIALISAMWFSILAPMSWYVIFKAHSFIHTHMSFLLWQMPFTLFGFAVFAVAVRWNRNEDLS